MGPERKLHAAAAQFQSERLRLYESVIGSTQTRLFQDPVGALLFDTDRPLLVEGDTAGVQNRRCEHCIRDRWEAILVVIFRLRQTGVHAACGVDELLNRDISVPALAVEMPTLRGRVFHAACGRMP